MKFAPLLLAVPVVLQAVAAHPRPTPGFEVRALDRWQFARQDSTATGGAGGGGGATATGGGGGNTQAEETTTTPTSRAQPTSATPAPSQSSEAQETKTSAAAETSSTREQTQPSSTAPAQSSASQTQQASTPQAPASTPPPSPIPTSSAVLLTDQSGKQFTSLVVITVTPTVASASASATDTSTGGDQGISKSTIIGLAVTGSIAVLLVIVLIVWKLTNKRFSDLDDTGDDAIKWPELQKDSAAMTPLPNRPSARAAITDDFDRQSTAANSTADLTGAQYPPYSDDPGYGARPAYYDPYGGAPGAVKPYASPPGSHDGDHQKWGAPVEGQYYDAPRGPSPGPALAYGDPIGRGTSPGPNMAYGDAMGRASPAPPSIGYDHMGRTASPAPTYGGYAGGYPEQGMGGDPYAGRRSPGPNMAYGANPDYSGRRSPGPAVAYGGAPGRVASPGPNVAYDQGYR